MPQTRWNKAQTIANADAYNLASDLATDADTLNVVVPVGSDTERNGLTPPQGSYAGETVARTDKPGVPFEVRDSAGVWNLHALVKVWANDSITGTNPLTGLQAGTLIPIIQAGTAVVVTDSNGYASIGLPQAFPNGIITAIFSNGDNTITNGSRMVVSGGTAVQTTSQLHIRAWDSGAGAGYASATIRVNWIAVGW